MNSSLSGFTFNFIGQIRCIISLDAGGHAAKAFSGLIPIVVEKPGLDTEYILGIPVAGNPIAPQDVTVDFSFGFIAV